jgi:alkylation response protein AidB-like acyl-CoA dehydrogenase
MDWRFTPEQERFRAEVRSFLSSALPHDWDGNNDADRELPEGKSWTKAFVKQLVAKGWFTMAWPKEYGGQARSVIEQVIYKEEMSYHNVSVPTLGGAGVSWVGPALMQVGTLEQKREFLPPISRGEAYWCTGYSEPDTGSDLASLETRAVRDGDDYVVNGSKIWTSSAHLSDWCWLAVRTDPKAPKHKGISMLMTNMRSPGIRIDPIHDISGGHHFNQVFFDNVRVPVRNRVGEENKGWYVIAMSLDFERSGISGAATNLRRVHDLRDFLGQQGWRHVPEAQKTILKHQLAEKEIEARLGRNLCYRIGWMQSHGLMPNAETSITKLFISESAQRISAFGMAVLGLWGQMWEGSSRAPLNGTFLRRYLFDRSATIAGGTSEVQRNVIASRGLGLPR